MGDEVNYEGWAIDLCCLLDAIEAALNENDFDKAHILLKGRFRIAENYGLEIVMMGPQAAWVQ